MSWRLTACLTPGSELSRFALEMLWEFDWFVLSIVYRIDELLCTVQLIDAVGDTAELARTAKSCTKQNWLKTEDV
jgi:hypothetical protein